MLQKVFLSYFSFSSLASSLVIVCSVIKNNFIEEVGLRGRIVCTEERSSLFVVVAFEEQKRLTIEKRMRNSCSLVVFWYRFCCLRIKMDRGSLIDNFLSICVAVICC